MESKNGADAAQTIARLERRLAVLSDATRAFSESSNDVTRLMKTAAHVVAEGLGDTCSLLILSADGSRLENLSTHSPDAEVLKRALEMRDPVDLDGHPTARAFFASGEPVFIPKLDLEAYRARTTPRYHGYLTATGVHGILVVALRARGETFGQFVLLRGRNNPVPLDASDLALAQALADHAALAIVNARSFEAERVARANSERLIEAAHAQAEASRLLFEGSPFAAFVIDTEAMRILAANDPVLKLYGYTRDEFVGIHLNDLRHPEALQELQRKFEKLGREDVTMVRGRHRHKDGSDLWIQFDSRAFTYEGKNARFVVTRDVTAQRLLEEQQAILESLQQKSEALAEENRRMHESSRLKSEFLANMSHELRTPLNAIIGFSEVMAEDKRNVTPTHREYLADILTSSRHLLRLINEVLDLAKVESGKMDFRPEWVDVPALASEARDILRGLAGEKKITIDLDVDRARGTFLDPSRLKQVLYNYLSNAIKFTPESGRVTLRMFSEPDEALMVEVVDTGIGVNEVDRHRLFVEFQQLDSGMAKKYAGTGLGLSLTKRIVEAQRGKVGVRSELGHGSTFWAKIPSQR